MDTEYNHVVTGGFDGVVRTWSTDGKLIDSVALCDAVQALCYVSASGHLWFSGTNHKIIVYDPRTGSEVTSNLSSTANLSAHPAEGSRGLLSRTAPAGCLNITF